jgi:putative tryptophan/tyrosine transport system substrate-binding protein
MKAKILVYALLALILAAIQLGEAQQPKKGFRIGYLSPLSEALDSTRRARFRQGLRDLGYVEGKDFTIEFRMAEGQRDRLPELTAEMVGLKPDVIVVSSTSFTRVVKKATNTIPIVVATAGDLVGTGLVASLARPGGNITGLTDISTDLSGKRLELLKEAVPKALRVAVFWNTFPGSQQDEDEVKQTEISALPLGFKIQRVPVRGPNEIERAFAAMKKENAGALVIIQGSFTNFHRSQIVELAAKNRLPTMCEQSMWTEEGCLLSYGNDPHYNWSRAATYVDKILKGTKPSDLPVEQPMKFEFVINLKTAKQIGVTIPPNVLARADKVIR